MSALGQLKTSDPRTGDVRFTPESGHQAVRLRCPLSANSRHRATQSITSSALAISVGGRLRPSARAVLRLMMNSNLVGACTGRSAGLAPFKMRST